MSQDQAMTYDSKIGVTYTHTLGQAPYLTLELEYRELCAFLSVAIDAFDYAKQQASLAEHAGKQPDLFAVGVAENVMNTLQTAEKLMRRGQS